MKKVLFIMSLMVSFWAIAQKKIQTKYFDFSCDCIEVENYYEPKNSSNNYSYINEKQGFEYTFATREILFRNKSEQKDFLKAIKNSGTFNYEWQYFLGQEAIIANLNSQQEQIYAKHIAFFYNNVAYTIMVFAKSPSQLKQHFNHLKNTLKLK
ncbi:hypothetical protein ACIRNY_11765 [Capnocytophaga canimorsus]|uniref:hypothetical protein n=1 Tax=Capnocytophaga canimorsus TaxID=28188 RepID=UPI00384F303A